jgi:hypothetical protein
MKKYFTVKNILILSAIIVVICFACAIIIILIPSPTSSETTLIVTPTPATIDQKTSVIDIQPSGTPEPTQTPEPTNTPKSTNTPRPTNTPVPTSTPILGLIKIGTHLVGDGITPGIYRGLAGQDITSSCYWARLSNLSGEMDAILANDNAIGQFYIEVLSTDIALETSCQLIQLEYAPILELGDELPAGTFIVGRDIQPGTYQGQAGEDILESCYWERLSNVSGDMNSIITNNNATGSYFIQVSTADFALMTGCPLTRVGD